MPVIKRRNLDAETYQKIKEENSQSEESLNVELTKYANEIPLSEISIVKNVRETYEDITELKNSIEQFGLLQPIVLVEQDVGYRIVMGHRRYLACKELGLATINAITIDKCDEKKIFLMQIAENIQRKKLKNSEIYNAIMELRKENNFVLDIAKQLNKSVGYVQAFINLEKLNLDNKKIDEIDVFKVGSVANKIKNKSDQEKQEAINEVQKKKKQAKHTCEDYEILVKAKNSDYDVEKLLAYIVDKIKEFGV